MSGELTGLTIAEMHGRLRRKEVSAVEQMSHSRTERSQRPDAMRVCGESGRKA